jgi:hypothetical protein
MHRSAPVRDDRSDTGPSAVVALFLLDLMAEHGQKFNGNVRPSTPGDRVALCRAFDTELSYMTDR